MNIFVWEDVNESIFLMLTLCWPTTGLKSGRSLLIEDGALPWIVQNANNEAAPIRRHIELALCHLAQQGKCHFLILIEKIPIDMFLERSNLYFRSKCKRNDQWRCTLGASSYLTLLFSRGHKSSCSSDFEFKFHLQV
jgi:hypothetical protein